jgi:hypothetical protein
MNNSTNEDLGQQDHATKNSSTTIHSLDKTTREIVTDILGEYSELILDSLVNNDVFGEIPVVNTVSAIYNLVGVVKAKRFHKKLQSFLEEMQTRKASEDETQAFRERFSNDKDYREDVMEHIIEQIEQLDSEYKTKILARLFISFTETHLSWRRFLDLSFALNRAHLIALERIAIQDENTIPPDSLKRPAWKDGIPIQAYLESASLLEACGLAARPEQPLEGTANIMLTDLGLDMLAFGVKPDGPWKAKLIHKAN